MKKSDSELFMSLFNYITGKNETGKVIHQYCPRALMVKLWYIRLIKNLSYYYLFLKFQKPKYL